MKITVCIVEDDRKTRESLVMVLRGTAGVHVLGAHSSGEEALACVPKEQPEVVLMDINLPGMSGVECVTRLKSQMPELRVLMLTTYEDSQLIFNSLRAGATGYILKNKSSVELLAALQQVHEGGAPMSMRIARKVVSFFNQLPAPTPETEQLSEREREVLAALARGMLYKEIATQLDISENTVRTYVKRIYEKLHVQTRTEAVAKFQKRLPGDL
jgi:DNA-binding NarL/FixJ family response regulator